MKQIRPPFSSRWRSFIAERFPLPAHAAMLGAYCFGNIGVVRAAVGEGVVLWRAVPLIASVCLTFFRLRIFDEIKDVSTDRLHHPDRPLARGLIPVGEAWRVSLMVAGLELILVAACGAAAAFAWCLAFGFSLLMKKEFFIGHWLSPRMELYAVSHTFVAALIGMTMASGLSGLMPWRLPADLLWAGAINWALFNVFEFARKSYASGEEPPGETYSKRLGPAGAAALTLSQFVIAGSVLACAGGGDTQSSGRAAAYVMVFGGPFLVSLPYAFGPTPPRARFFRAAMLALALATYVVLPYAGMVS